MNVIAESMFSINQEGTDEYGQATITVQGRHFFEFTIETCTFSPVVAMYGDVQKIFAYLLQLGGQGNDEITILDTDNGEIVARVTYMDVTQCGRRVPYWVGWKGGLVEVGRGLYPHNRLLEWQDPQPKVITSLVLMTLDDKFNVRLPVPMQPPKWEFKKNSGE